jgi:hypothetical protein
MNYKKLIHAALNHNRNSGMTTVAAIAGLAIGAAISILFAPDSGSATRTLLGRSLGLKKRFPGSGNGDDKDPATGFAIEDIRGKTWEHADQLQGPEKKRKNASLIKVPSAGTNAWKENEIKEQRPTWSSRDRI